MKQRGKRIQPPPRWFNHKDSNHIALAIIVFLVATYATACAINQFVFSAWLWPDLNLIFGGAYGGALLAGIFVAASRQTAAGKFDWMAAARFVLIGVVAAGFATVVLWSQSQPVWILAVAVGSMSIATYAYANRRYLADRMFSGQA